MRWKFTSRRDGNVEHVTVSESGIKPLKYWTLSEYLFLFMFLGIIVALGIAICRESNFDKDCAANGGYAMHTRSGMFCIKRDNLIHVP